ncbi:hypothetical protein [Roseibium sediminis]|uniref:hypothetical protein n=1 Tax=Roseibium sediminis TaxID=1775174 RepID=UPI00123D3917|nr:hypothetical protein [Roseibium sediminis]
MASTLIKAVLGTRTGCVLVAILSLMAVLFIWHKLDKSSAVRTAVVGYVAKVELETAQAELTEMRRRRAAFEAANSLLNSRIEQAETQAQEAALELEYYESTVGEACRVDRALLDRLHNR